MNWWKRVRALWAMAPAIEGVRRVHVAADDTLVLEYPFAFSMVARENLRQDMERCGFRRVLVLEEGMTLRAVLERTPT